MTIIVGWDHPMPELLRNAINERISNYTIISSYFASQLLNDIQHKNDDLFAILSDKIDGIDSVVYHTELQLYV